jgi:hypothetical protein
MNEAILAIDSSLDFAECEESFADWAAVSTATEFFAAVLVLFLRAIVNV